MNWYLDSGKDSDVVVSTRVRLARNINNYPFKNRMTNENKKELLEKIKYVAPSLGYGLKFINIKDLDDITKLTLVENHIISPDIISGKEDDENVGILINQEENICIMINEEDHIRLQVFESGLDLKNTMSLAREIEEKLDEELHFAYSKDYGYLTSCPTNLGTGLRASVMVHLPGLKLTGNLSKILKIVNNFGMTIRGTYGEESKSIGDIYQISNNQSIGLTEEDIITNIDNITKKVIEQERLARKKILENKIEFEDRIARSLGVFLYAKKISSEEAIKLLSDIKLGVDLGIIKEINDKKVKELEIYTKPASLQKKVGKVLNSYERDINRAEIIKQIVSNGNNL